MGNTVSQERPTEGRLPGGSTLDQTQEWANVKRRLMRKGKARIEVSTVIEYEGRVAGRFSGEFVALIHDSAPLAIETDED